MKLVLSGLLWLSCVASASAQVVVVRVDPAAERLSAMLEAELAGAGVVPDPGYFAEAQRRGLDPQNAATLALLIPGIHARLAIVPRAEDAASAAIEFRDGASGAELGGATIPLDNGMLGETGRSAFALAVRARLGQPQPQSQSQLYGVPSASTAGGPASDASAEADPGVSPARERKLLVSVHGGIGVGTRELTAPGTSQALAVSMGLFSAAELGARLAVALSRSIWLGPELAYQTSLHDSLEEPHVAGNAAEINVRAERFSAALAATFGLGARADFQLGVALGFGIRALRPAVHQLLTPAYSLAGPLAQVKLRIPIGTLVALRLAPEAQYVFVSEGLRERGVGQAGFSLGGEAGIEFSASKHVQLELAYREAHALLQAASGPNATDVERYITARVGWEL